MKKTPGILLFFIIALCSCSNKQDIKINSLEMRLDAPGIQGFDSGYYRIHINFDNNMGGCCKTSVNPDLGTSGFMIEEVINKEQIKTILQVLEKADLKKLRHNYDNGKTNQPLSVTIINTNQGNFKITDRGLIGDAPLRKLYYMVYKHENSASVISY